MEKVTVLMSNPSSTIELLHVATLGKSVGLRGFMKLHVHSDFLEQFVDKATFFLDNDQTITIEIIKNSLVKLVGVKSLEDAKQFTNKKLYVTKKKTRESCKLNDNQFFYFDIIGSMVIENNQHLGKIENIERIGDIDYLIIKTDKELVHDNFAKSFLIPYIEKFISSVDIKNQTIEVYGGFEILEAS